MSSLLLSGLLGTLKSTLRINKATVDASVLTVARTQTLQDLAGIVALSQRLLPVLGVTPSANQDNYSPTGLADAGILRVNASASIKLTGLATGAEGRVLVVWNASTDYLLWLEHENTSSTAANRFTLPKAFPAFLMPGDMITLLYDATATRWIVWSWSSQGPAMGLMAFSDFVGENGQVAINNTAQIGPFGAVTSGTAATIQTSTYLIDTTEKPAGVVQLDTGSQATGRSTIGSPNTGDIVPAQGPALSIARLAVETTVDGTQTFQVFTGFIDAAAGPTNGAAWNNRWNGSAAEWSQDRWAAGTPTRTASGSPSPDNTYICLAVFLNAAWSRADFLYSTDGKSFTKAGSPTTGLPSGAQNTVWTAISIIKSAGATARNISLDYAGCRVDYARG